MVLNLFKNLVFFEFFNIEINLDNCGHLYNNQSDPVELELRSVII